MPIHQKLRLTRQHGLDEVPDDFLDRLLQFEHLAQLDRRLSCICQHSLEKEVEWQVPIFVPFQVRLSVLLHLLDHFDDLRVLLPGQFANDPALNLPELPGNLIGHISVQVEEDVENPEQVEGSQVYKLHHGGELHLGLGRNAELQLRGADYNGLEEQRTVHEFLDQLQSLLLFVLQEDPLEDLRAHSKHIGLVNLSQLHLLLHPQVHVQVSADGLGMKKAG